MLYWARNYGGNARVAWRRDARTHRWVAQPPNQRFASLPDDVRQHRLRSHLRLPWHAVPSDGAVRNQREARTLDILRRNGG